MGGTFMSLPAEYRDYFVRGLHDALSGHTSSNVAEAVRFSEQSHTRCIGLTIETRPDYCLGPHLDHVCQTSLVGCFSVPGIISFLGSKPCSECNKHVCLATRKLQRQETEVSRAVSS